MNIKTLGLLLGITSWTIVCTPGDVLAQERKGGGQGPANYSASETMTFRDLNGFPKWAGRGRR